MTVNSSAQFSPEERYYNRDLSWLSFNYRVLLEAADKSLPLYERIKFLAIYSSNLDEFYHIRVASIKSLATVKKKKLEKLSLAPDQLLEDIRVEVEKHSKEFSRIFYQDIMPELAENKINLILGEPVKEIHQSFVRNYFEDEVKAFLHPELLRKNKIVHFLRDDALYLVVKLRNQPKHSHKPGEANPDEEIAQFIKSKKRIRYALIQIPTHYFPRFVELPQVDYQHYFTMMDDIIRFNLKAIFPGYDILAAHSIRLTRNADLMIEDEFEGNLIDKITKSLKKRRVGIPVKFLYDKDMPKSMLKYLRATFGISKMELMPGDRYHSDKDLFGLPNPVGSHLERVPTPPLNHDELESHASIFEAIKAKNWILHFPYHSYNYVIKFLNEAAVDPKVSSIRATQYRVASNSAIVSALALAARNGKKVTVFVELKARFDEAANLASAKEMEEAGVNIIYSIPGLKVHAKVAMVTRAEGETKRRYAFLSTGNFNEKTARIYADHGYFTCDETTTQELKELFFHLEDRKYKPPKFSKLLVAQFNMRSSFTSMIYREIEHAQAGKPADILIKANNLEDPKMIEHLYAASQAGVKVTLIIRGICCLRPGIKGLSENITVRRIVDQFLEHARVFVFHNLGANETYLASADWMQRNLDRRIELSFPINDQDLKEEVLEILRIQLRDNVKAVELNANLENIPVPPDPDNPIRTQNLVYDLIRTGQLVPKPLED